MAFTALVILLNLPLRADSCLDLLAMTESFSERRSRSSFLDVDDVSERRCLRLWISRLSWKIWSLYRAAVAEWDDGAGPPAVAAAVTPVVTSSVEEYCDECD